MSVSFKENERRPPTDSIHRTRVERETHFRRDRSENKFGSLDHQRSNIWNDSPTKYHFIQIFKTLQIKNAKLN